MTTANSFELAAVITNLWLRNSKGEYVSRLVQILD